jgi:plasmid stability protein
MPALHGRNVDDAVIEALKRRAAQHHRSLEGELRHLLERAAYSETSRRQRPRKLRLKTVRVGSKSAYGRDEIYGSEER